MRRLKEGAKKEGLICYDRYRLRAPEICAGLAKGAAACGVLAYTFYRSLMAFCLLLPAGLAVSLVLEQRRRKEKRRLLLEQQFKESLIVLAGSLSAGYAMENALRKSCGELAMLYGEEALIVREFEAMVQQLRMSRTVEQVLEDFARRSGLEDARSFAEVFSAAKRSGGDLSGIMRHTAEVIRDKLQVKEEIRTLTASRQFEQKIMNGIPFFIVFYIEGSSPGFFGQMYGTAAGRLLMTVCLAIYMAAILLADRILDIRV